MIISASLGGEWWAETIVAVELLGVILDLMSIISVLVIELGCADPADERAFAVINMVTDVILVFAVVMFAPELAICLIPLIVDGVLVTEPVWMVLIQGIFFVEFKLTILAFKHGCMCCHAVYLQCTRVGINQLAAQTWELEGVIPLAMHLQFCFASEGAFTAVASKYWHVRYVLMCLQQHQAGVASLAFGAGKDGWRTRFRDRRRTCPSDRWGIRLWGRFAGPWCMNL